MLDALTNLTLHVMDFLIGWLLYLPMDVALVIVALGTGAVLTFVRPWTTDQEMLRRCKADKKKLASARKAAKRAGDKQAVVRIRATEAAIATKLMKAEGKPLLAVLLPILMLATWAFARLGYVPPQPGAPVSLSVSYPAAAVGQVAHVVPQDGLTAETGWIQRIAADNGLAAGGKVLGVATWRLKAAKREAPYTLQIRHAGETASTQLLVDGRRYYGPVDLPSSGGAIEVRQSLDVYKPFGFIPGIPWIAFDPWLVGYLVLAVPFVFLLRWLCRIL